MAVLISDGGAALERITLLRSRTLSCTNLVIYAHSTAHNQRRKNVTQRQKLSNDAKPMVLWNELSNYNPLQQFVLRLIIKSHSRSGRFASFLNFLALLLSVFSTFFLFLRSFFSVTILIASSFVRPGCLASNSSTFLSFLVIGDPHNL
jgi:hypothetical protein